MRKIKGFTLAEVLITLSVLGIVAAVAIPSIHRNFQEKIQITQLRRAFSILDSAIKIMFTIEGKPKTWSSYTKDTFMSNLRKYLNVQTVCSAITYTGKDYSNDCAIQPWYYKYKNIDGSGIHSLNSFKDAGVTLTKQGFTVNVIDVWTDYFGSTTNKDYILQYHPHHTLNEPLVGGIAIDINGKKSPNRLGYDIFYFLISTEGIVLSPDHDATADNDIGKYMHPVNCEKGRTNYYLGYSCGNYVMRHGNMDYKKRVICPDWRNCPEW